jgi:hypothetical protein
MLAVPVHDGNNTADHLNATFLVVVVKVAFGHFMFDQFSLDSDVDVGHLSLCSMDAGDFDRTLYEC